MARKKAKASKNFKITRFNKFLIITLVISLGILFFYTLNKAWVNSMMISSLPETDKTEIKKIPRDIAITLKSSSPSATFRVPILLYHYVEYVKDPKDTIRQSLNINPDIFEEEVKTLLGAGYSFITMKDLADILDGTKLLPTKPVVLTFDDGYRDFYIDVLPILKKYQIHATAYLVSGFIGGSNSMLASQVVEATQSGLVEVGAHTVHHTYLKGRPLESAKFEINQSKKDLEKEFNIHIVSFAYPYGAFDKQAVDLVKEAGFKTATSTVPGIMADQSNRFFLYRLRPGRRIGKALVDYLEKNSFSEY